MDPASTIDRSPETARQSVPAAALAPAHTMDPSRSSGAELPVRKIPLGEELPIFCEKCGYALHGLPQTVCGHCTIRQFHCPECGHHQPINTLRPAFQRLLGRARAFFLVISVLFKLNFFVWLLVAWVAMGVEWSYTYRYDEMVQQRAVRTGGGGQRFVSQTRVRLLPRELDLEQMAAFSAFAMAFGMFGRMLLLRWRRGYLVGLCLAALVCLAVLLGAYMRKITREEAVSFPSPLTSDFLITLATTAATVTLGASVVWGIWIALAHVFLPKRTCQALLDWQRSLSNRPAAALGRD